MLRNTCVALTLLALAPAAFAQSTQEVPPLTAAMLEDADVVSLEGNYDAQMWENSAPLEAMVADLNRIGGVEDVMIDSQGTILGVTTNVGGFLGIADNTVMIPLEDLRLIRSSSDISDVTVITRLSREQLEDLEEIDD